LRKLKSNVDKIEKEIEKTEVEITEMDEVLASDSQSVASDPNFYDKYKALKTKLDQLMEDWEKATEEVESFG
jgi:ATP-binding cassette subfamily F protein 3